MEWRSLKGVTVSELMDSYLKSNDAQVRQSSDLRPRMVQTIPLNLAVAVSRNNPMVLMNPFDGVWMGVASDASVKVNLCPGGYDEYNLNQPIGMTLNSAFKADKAVKQCSLWWDAQPGQTAEITFFLGIDFRPGSYLSQISGGVTLIGGTSIATGTLGSGGNAANVAVTDAAAVQLCVINSQRKAFNFYTDTIVWIGDSGVTVNRGTRVMPGSWVWNNTGALYAIAELGGVASISGSEEE